MRLKDSHALPVGVYRVHWKSGGYSVASIGMDEAGNRWVAPANWLLSDEDGPDAFDIWRKIDRVELIEAANFTLKENV